MVMRPGGKAWAQVLAVASSADAAMMSLPAR
jgi:hypothetical protein